MARDIAGAGAEIKSGMNGGVFDRRWTRMDTDDGESHRSGFDANYTNFGESFGCSRKSV
jgi:hypothetical protein